MTDFTPEDAGKDIYDTNTYIDEMLYTHYPPSREETVYFVPMTGKRLTTIAFLLEKHQIPGENLTENQQEALQALHIFVQDMQKKHDFFYNAVFAKEGTPESDDLLHE